MSELLDVFADAAFIQTLLGELAPAVGFGAVLGVIVAVAGWTWGLVIRAAKVDL